MQTYGYWYPRAQSPGERFAHGQIRARPCFAEDDERAGSPRFQGDLFAGYLAVADQLKSVAAEKNITMVQLAIAWLLRREEVTCVLVGAKNSDQVKEHVGAADVAFSDDELERIEKILQDTPNGF